MKNKNFFFQFLNKIILIIPIFIVLIYYFDLPILDVDALAYHLFTVRLIEENIFFFFQRLNINIGSSLGYELSVFYPNLYSYLIYIVKKITYFNLYKASYVFSCILYLFSLTLIKNDIKRIYFAIYILIPTNFTSLLVSGNNYFLAAFLIFVLFVLFYEKKNIFLIFTVSLLLINTHVLMPYIISILFFCEIFFERNKKETKIKFIVVYFIIIFTQLFTNYYITGSITFPFLQSVFPNNDYNPDTWNVIVEHIERSIFYANKYSNLNFKLMYLVLPIFLFLLVIIDKNLNKKTKLIFLLIILPSIFFYKFGFRHRIIFLTASFLIFCYIINISNTLEIFLDKINKLLKKAQIQILILFPIMIFFILKVVNSPIIKNNEFDKFNFYSNLNAYSHISNSKYIRYKFYKILDDLSKQNKILYTEIPVAIVQNYKNLINPLSYIDQINSFKTYDEFYNFLKEYEFNYLTHTPLSSNNPFNVKYPHIKFLDDLVKNKKLKILINLENEYLYQNKDLEEFDTNWIIYEVE